MPAAEPHPRRRVALRRALSLSFAAIVLAGPAAPGAAGQVPLPTSSTTAPAPATTEADPVETTTTTEAERVQTTTTTSVTGTTARRATTAPFDDEGEAVVTDEDVLDDAEIIAEDEPLETTSTARDLLVGGDGSDGAESTSTTSTTVVEVAADDDALDEQAQIWLIVAGLVIVALLIGVWTYRYWVRTRPAPVEEDPDPTTVFRQG